MKHTKVNFGFISALEGGPVCIGYVPDPEHSQSGVTIGTGFDLGQCNTEELARMLTPSLAAKLAPYAGIKKLAAVALLQALPLKVKPCEADLIDRCVKADAIGRVAAKYDGQSKVPFCDLPEHAQTVIASVAFQYGDLSRRCPKFWGLAVRQDWQGMVTELNQFGDRYPSRRHKEARYLQLMFKEVA